MSDFLTIDELAEAVKVSTKTIERWAADGVIPTAVREGKVVRFDLVAVKRALAKRAAKSAVKCVKPAPDGMALVI